MFIEKLGARPGASPLFTHYDEASGSRVELSGTTFTNWVDKTVNMLDGLGVEAGEPVHLDLVNTSPGHWMTAVWVAAIWQRGCPVAARNDGEAVFTVVGPASDTRGLVTVMRTCWQNRTFTGRSPFLRTLLHGYRTSPVLTWSVSRDRISGSCSRIHLRVGRACECYWSPRCWGVAQRSW